MLELRVDPRCSKDEIVILVNARGDGYKSISALRNAGVSLRALEKLADADAFRPMGMDRGKALWDVSALQGYAGRTV